jgi:L-2-hydroxycarboxylate dehydrogenase (NAD+)
VSDEQATESGQSGDRARTYGQWWDWHGPYTTVPLEELEGFVERAWEAVGASPENARLLCSMALEKTIQGDHARGLVYFPMMARLARQGVLDVNPDVQVVRDHGATAVVDGGRRAAGFLVCHTAMRLAVEKARAHGVGLVGAKSAAGILGPLAELAAREGMVGIVLTQTMPAVAPLGGVRPMLGNAPFAVAVPTAEHDPVILDMSFTESSASGVLLSMSQDVPLPPGIVLDEHGEPTTDPHDFTDDPHTRAGAARMKGSLVPVGGGHKGYAVVFIVGLLAALLSDTDPPFPLSEEDEGGRGGRQGTVHIAVNPAVLNPRHAGQMVDAFIDALAESPRRPGQEILYPGQRSQELRRARRARGTVDVPTPQVEAMAELGDLIGLPVPVALRG